MSDLDLTAAVESAARIMHDANCCDRWDSHGNSFRETWRAEAREVLSAAAPVIAAQARRWGRGLPCASKPMEWVDRELTWDGGWTVIRRYERARVCGPWREVPNAD